MISQHCQLLLLVLAACVLFDLVRDHLGISLESINQSSVLRNGYWTPEELYFKGQWQLCRKSQTCSLHSDYMDRLLCFSSNILSSPTSGSLQLFPLKIFPERLKCPHPPTHPHLVTGAHQKCYFRIILAEVRGLGMQRHRVSQPGQRDSCSNTAISTQLRGQTTAFSISWGGKPSLPKETLLTTQYLKTGLARKPSQFPH